MDLELFLYSRNCTEISRDMSLLPDTDNKYKTKYISLRNAYWRYNYTLDQEQDPELLNRHEGESRLSHPVEKEAEKFRGWFNLCQNTFEKKDHRL